MPNPHFDVQIISRGSGRSAVASSSYRSGSKVARHAGGKSVVAAASYRSGQQLYDEQADRIFDYTRKEDVIYAEIRLPDMAPEWAADRERLWNQVETVEKRKDAQLARDIIAALPRELDKMQQIALVQEFIDTHFTARGMIADWALHTKVASDGGQNPHVHIMLTLRDVDAEGFGKKNRDWNKLTLVGDWREAWATLTNQYLAEAGRNERLDLRSYEEQGIARVPEQHMGYDNWHRESRGRETKTGNHNRRVHHENSLHDVARLLYRSPDSTSSEPAPQRTDARISDAAHLRQVSRETPTGDAAAISPARDLGMVARQLDPVPQDPARTALDTMKSQFAHSMLSRTVQATVTLVERATSHTRRWLESRRNRARETMLTGPFARFSSLKGLATAQQHKDDSTHRTDRREDRHER